MAECVSLANGVFWRRGADSVGNVVGFHSCAAGYEADLVILGHPEGPEREVAGHGRIEVIGIHPVVLVPAAELPVLERWVAWLRNGVALLDRLCVHRRAAG